MNIFKKKLTLIAYLFLRLPLAKNVVRYMCKKFHFRLSFQNEHGERVSNLFKFEPQNLYHIYWSTRRLFSCKKFVLVICKCFRLFVNTMSAVDKCSLPNRDNLLEPIHMQLSKKLKTFFQLFRAFSKSRLNFKHFQKKRWRSSLIYLWGYGLRKSCLDICVKVPLQINLPKGTW